MSSSPSEVGELVQFGALCARLGVLWNPGASKLGRWAWDGRQICGQRPDEIYHELGHWLCAEPHLRPRPGFGMEAGAYRTDAYEEEASAAGILVHWLHDESAALEHAAEHSWADAVDAEVAEWNGLAAHKVELRAILLRTATEGMGGRRALALLRDVGLELSLGDGP